MKKVFKHARVLFHGISRLGASGSHCESVGLKYGLTPLVPEPGRSSFRLLRRSFSVGSESEVEKGAGEFMYVTTHPASVKGSDGNIQSHYLGVVVRNSEGDFKHGFTKLTTETKTDTAELEGIRASIKFCHVKGYKKIRIFTDSQHSVKRLMSGKDEWLKNEAIMEIKNLANTFDHVQIIWLNRNFVKVAHAAAAVKEVHDLIVLEEPKWAGVRTTIRNEKTDFASVFLKPLRKYNQTSIWVA